MYKYLIILIMMATAGKTAQSQKLYLSKNEAIEDINYLKKTLEEVHPDLYALLPEKEFDMKLQELIQGLQDSVKLTELSLKLCKIVNTLRDGHTHVSRLQGSLCEGESQPTYFPLQIDLKQNYRIRNAEAYKIEQGAELLTINEMPIEEIVDSILWTENGEYQHRKIVALEYVFPRTLWEIIGFRDTFDITYRHHDTIHHSRVSGSSKPTFYNLSWNLVGNFSTLQSGTETYGILTLLEFGSTKTYYDLIDSTFRELNKQGISKLLIDIRENGGGNTMLAEHIFQYISPQAFKLFESLTIQHSKLQRSSIRKDCPLLFLPILMCTHYYWKKKGKKIHYPKLEAIKLDESKRFKGDVYLITSNYCYSTADSFARAFKHYKMGTIIGEETGGMKDSFGDSMMFNLPHSKIRCWCSYKYFKRLDLNDLPTDGVKPDYPLDCRHLSNRELVDYIEKHVKDSN